MMADWEPMDSPFPDTWEEEYTLRLPSGAWIFRRIGENSWLDADDFAYVVELAGLAKFSLLLPEPDYASEGTEFLVAKPPMVYIAVGDGELGIEDVTCGTFDVTWYDLARGRRLAEGERDLDGGDETFEPPEGADGRVALYLRRTSR